MKSKVHPTYKTKYRVANWPAYNRALVRRGDVTVWLSSEAITAWTPRRSGRRGGQRRYSDRAIETALTLRLLYHLPLRQAEGFLHALFGIMRLDLSVPDDTTLSRRSQHLRRRLRSPVPPGEGLHLVLDSTGLSLVGAGEWATAKHGGRGRRGWRKLHLGVDQSGAILVHTLTEATGDDATTALDLLIAVDGPLVRITADAASDTVAVYETATARGATVVIPPPWSCLGAQLAISVNNCPPPRDPRSRMTSFKRTQRKDVQKAYRVRNWREYETGLRARGSLTVWLGLTDGKLANWNSPRPTRRKPGRQRKYSNHAIETTVTLGLVFGLASRQTEGFLRSRLTLLNLDNDVPDHSTISRRKARLGKVASYERRTVKPVHLRIDSSGLSVHVGQWRTPPKARDYRKLHLAVDEQTSDVVACELTSKRARDASRVASLVGQIERPIASAKADAAYDTGDVYKTLENHRAHRSPTVLIPPRKGAQLALDSAGTRQRNRNIRARSRVGKRKWYVASGYSRRSKVETTFHRYKAILGSAMRARGLASQRVEVRLGCKILNTMTALGIPDGEMIG